jgi:hypothetical protein
MSQWTGEISVRRTGKSYDLPTVFVSVKASNYVTAVGAATREAKRRLAVTHKGVRIEQVSVKVIRVAGSDEKPTNREPKDDGTGMSKDEKAWLG